ncbi:MAG TPA: hypothetical protein PK405_03415 [Hyphomicrobiales bacterium]|nr:hypothetical protein [Rhodobiaceae bacterium]HXK53711.1 hypothetical protein [Hyphomicrobiales bacterium]
MNRGLRFSRLPGRILAAIGLIACLAATPAMAQGMAPGQGMTPGMAPGQGGLAQIMLSEDKVVGFVESFPRLRALGDKYNARADARRESGNPASAFAAMATNESAMREMNALLAEYGFADFNDWVQVATSIMFAHQWKDDGKDPASQMDKAIVKIQQNQQLGEQQKAALIAQIEAQRGMVAALRPHPDNVALVRKYGEQIETAIKQPDEAK